MPTPPRKFSDQFCYHVYNCGVEKRITFNQQRDYGRFLGAITYYLFEQRIPYSEFLDLAPEDQKIYTHSNQKAHRVPRVFILAYCLMPNHFHFLLRQAKDGGVTSFMSDLANSYTKYFNTKNKRLGNLFRGPFSAKEISSQESFLQVSRYIHLNPTLSKKVAWRGKIELYPYSSCKNWVKGIDDSIVGLKEIKKFVEFNPVDYKKFIESKLPENFYLLNSQDLLLEKAP